MVAEKRYYYESRSESCDLSSDEVLDKFLEDGHLDSCELNAVLGESTSERDLLSKDVKSTILFQVKNGGIEVPNTSHSRSTLKGILKSSFRNIDKTIIVKEK